MAVLDPEFTPGLFRDIWRERRAAFLAGIGPAGARSRLLAAGAVADCSTVLDVGCGPGVFRATLALTSRPDPLARYVGVDAVEEMLPESANLPGPPPTVEWIEAKAESLPFEAGEFEGVVVRHLLEHLEDPYEVLREAARVCSRIVVLVFSQWPRNGGKSMISDAYLKAIRWSHPERLLRAELDRAGFQAVAEERYDPSPENRKRLAPREAIWVCWKTGTKRPGRRNGR